MAAYKRRARARPQGSGGGEPNCGPRKIVPKSIAPKRVERAMEIRAYALKLLAEQGRWTKRYSGPEVLRLENSRFSIIFFVQPPVPLELRERISPLGRGLYGLHLWDRRIGKVLNINWQSVGATPRIVTFKRGDWEQAWIPPAG